VTTHRLGLPLWTILLLGLLAAPRVVLHDLDLIQEGSAVNAVFVFVPLLVWVAVAVWRAGNPFLALLAAGAVYGVCLAVGHNLFGDLDGAALGGNLDGRLSPGTGDLVLRAAMTVSSVFTGLAVGTICGVVAWVLARLIRRAHRDR
jgi:hypothetical protein